MFRAYTLGIEKYYYLSATKRKRMNPHLVRDDKTLFTHMETNFMNKFAHFWQNSGSACNMFVKHFE